MPKLTTLLPLCLLLLLPATAGATAFTIAGFGDSLTCDTCNDGSYLRLLDDFLPFDPIIDDNGVGAQVTSTIFARLDTWINDGFTADLLILMGGIVDTYQPKTGIGKYVEGTTLDNLGKMIDLVLGKGIQLLVMAPPPVTGSCANPLGGLTCSDINDRLFDLAAGIHDLAPLASVPFVNLYDLFSADPRISEIPGTADSFYRADGLHLSLTNGDDLIASTLAPLIEDLLTGDQGGAASPPPIPSPEPTSPVLYSLNLLIGGFALRRRRSASR